MDENKWTQLHDDLSKKYVSRITKNLFGGLALGVCACSLGALDLNYAGNPNINDALGAGFYIATCGFFAGTFNGIRHAYKFTKFPKEFSDLVLKEKF